MRGYGNKDIYWPYAGTEPMSLYSPCIDAQTLLDVSCVHVMHRKQGCKYKRQWETDLCEAKCISLNIEVMFS